MSVVGSDWTHPKVSERWPKLDSPIEKVLNPGICKETKMDRGDPSQTTSNQGQHLYSYHTSSSTHTTMTTTNRPLPVPSPAGLV